MEKTDKETKEADWVLKNLHQKFKCIHSFWKVNEYTLEKVKLN